MLTNTQERFIKKRRGMVKLWPWVGSVLLVMTVGIWGYFFFKLPFLVNPFYVINKIKGGTLNHSMLTIMAAFSPLGFLICGLLLVVFIIFLFSAMSNEKRLIEIIDSLRKE